jgi:8-oxo-dGTP pyrophosphatase MutT (NUDIX family)
VSVIVDAMNSTPSVYRVDRLDLRYDPKPWAFAIERRAEIDAFFASMQREKPALWNGRVLLLHHQVLVDGAFRGAYLETDYASFAAWHAWGMPPAGVHDGFGAAAITTTDGAWLLGVMGAHTFNAGQIYFPCGTPDPDDIVNGRLDLDHSVQRELKEETGLEVADFAAEPGWTIVVDGELIVAIKVLRSAERAEALRTRVLAQLARERQPELADIRIVRGPADFDAAMPDFVTTFLAQRFAEG